MILNIEYTVKDNELTGRLATLLKEEIEDNELLLSLIVTFNPSVYGKNVIGTYHREQTFEEIEVDIESIQSNGIEIKNFISLSMIHEIENIIIKKICE